MFEIASECHARIGDISKKLMKKMISNDSFRRCINRIFTQILYQNKKEYV